jgi:hypothetical protein
MDARAIRVRTRASISRANAVAEVFDFSFSLLVCLSQQHLNSNPPTRVRHDCDLEPAGLWRYVKFSSLCEKVMCNGNGYFHRQSMWFFTQLHS